MINVAENKQLQNIKELRAHLVRKSLITAISPEIKKSLSTFDHDMIRALEQDDSAHAVIWKSFGTLTQQKNRTFDDIEEQRNLKELISSLKAFEQGNTEIISQFPRYFKALIGTKAYEENSKQAEEEVAKRLAEETEEAKRRTEEAKREKEAKRLAEEAKRLAEEAKRQTEEEEALSKKKHTAENILSLDDNISTREEPQHSGNKDQDIIVLDKREIPATQPLLQIILQLDNHEPLSKSSWGESDRYLDYLKTHNIGQYYEYFNEIRHQLTQRPEDLETTVKFFTELADCFDYLTTSPSSHYHLSTFPEDYPQFFIQRAKNDFLDHLLTLASNPTFQEKNKKDVQFILNMLNSGMLFDIPPELQSKLQSLRTTTYDDSVLALDFLSNVFIPLYLEQPDDTSAVTEDSLPEIQLLEESQPVAEPVQPPAIAEKNDTQKPVHQHPYYLNGQAEVKLREVHQYDAELTQELRESFIDESETELFPLIEQSVQNLRNHLPFNEEDILNLRRAFHTLKGSGMMASFVEAGEFGWQVERVLNEVRDHNFSFSEAVLYHALDGYEAIKKIVRGDAVDLMELGRVTYQANYLISHKGIIQPADLAQSTPELNSDISEIPAEISAITQSEILPETPSDQTDAVQEIDQSQEAYMGNTQLPVMYLPKDHIYRVTGFLEVPPRKIPAYDPDIAAELNIDFKAEAQEDLFPVIEHALEQLKISLDNEPLLLDMRRAFHTLKGSGLMAANVEVGEISWQIERVLNEVREQHFPLSEAIIYHAEDGYSAVKNLLDGKILPANELERIAYQAEYLISHKGVIVPNTPSAPVISTEISTADNLPLIETEPVIDFSPEPEDIVTDETILDAASAIEALPEIILDNEPTPATKTVVETIATAEAEMVPFIEIPSESTHDAAQVITTLPDVSAHTEIFGDAMPSIDAIQILETTPTVKQSSVPTSEDIIYNDETLMDDLKREFNTEELPKNSAFYSDFLEEEDLDNHDVIVDNEELIHSLFTTFETCKNKTHMALKEYARNIGICFYNPLFDNNHSENRNLLSAYHRHLLLYRAHGLTPKDSTLTFWKEVLDIIIDILQEHQTQPEIIAELLPRLQEPVIALPNNPVTQKTQVEEIELDEELYAAYVEEAHDLLETSDQLLQQWQKTDFDPGSELIAEFRRQMHTIKGGARMVGRNGIGDISHAIESLLDPAHLKFFSSDIRRYEILQRSLDHILVMLEHKSSKLDQEGYNLLSALHLLLGNETPPETDIEGNIAGDETITHITEKTTSAARAELSALRIAPKQLTEITENLAETTVLTNQQRRTLSQLLNGVGELERTIARLGSQARRIEIETEAQIISRHARIGDQQDFDPLELDQFSELQHLSRSIMESVEDLNSLHKNISDSIELLSTNTDKQSSTQSTVSKTLTDIGTVTFTSIIPRLRRIVRQVSKSQDKKIDLVAIGAEIQVERMLLEQMIAPLEHMVRNAVVHGIESPQDRLKAGKPETGKVTLKVMKQGAELTIQVIDDGRGFNTKKILEKAISSGMVKPNQSISDNELVNMVMLPGLTTAENVSHDAGRGVGLDVLSKALMILKAQLSLHSVPNEGATFEVRIPFTLSVINTLIIRAGTKKFSIPLTNIVGVAQDKGIIKPERNNEFFYQNKSYQIYDLDKIYNQISIYPNNTKERTYLLYNSENQRIAIGISQIISQLEVVMRPLNPQIASIPGIVGSAVMPDGDIIYILDIPRLTNNLEINEKIRKLHNKKVEVLSQYLDTEIQQSRTPSVLVVDDSITMRRVSQRMLERVGLRVITAKDGLDAIEKLSEMHPDIMMLDIEMPRMDGFEVLSYMKSQERLSDIPIIMITSRTGEKHKQRAFDLGANEYCGKPYQEDEIIAIIQNLLGDKWK